MTKKINVLVFILTVIHSYAFADCRSLYEWKSFTSSQGLLDQVDSLSRDPHDQKELFDTETCLKEQADQLNDWWTTRHFELVELINQTQKTITRVEKQQIEINQIQEEIEIQKQAIQSLKLIYQSKLLEIPTAYLLVAKKRVDVGVVQKDVERALHDACLKFLQIRYTDHHIKSETKIKNYRVVSDFIEDFQGGRAQSFEFDPVVYQDEKEILHYTQVFRLYPLFSVEKKPTVKKLLDASLVTEEHELAKYISNIENLYDGAILPIIQKQHSTQLQNMRNRVEQINGESLSTLRKINKNYYSKISVEEKNLRYLNTQLKKITKLLNSYPEITKLRNQLDEYQIKLNEHVNSREIIVVTNPSELSHSGTAVTDQYGIILKQAYHSLIERARESKAYKFYRVENGRLTEAHADTYFSQVEPTQYVMPFFRKTHRKAEGVWRIGIVLGLRVKLSHDQNARIVYQSVPDDENKSFYRILIWCTFLFFILCLMTLFFIFKLAKRKPQKKSKKISSPKTGNKKINKPKKSITNSVGMTLNYISPGTFLMGSPLDEDKRTVEEVQHKVILSKGFFMASTPVTVSQWLVFMQDTKYKTEAETGGGAIIKLGDKWEKQANCHWRNPGFSQDKNHPVTCISWNDAEKFILWLNHKEGCLYRLPTEAEWEYACRAGTSTTFSFGHQLSTNQANFNGMQPLPGISKRISRKRTTPVSKFPANSLGLYDMHGNVWEWCQDRYGDYSKTDTTDPKGPISGSRRVDRGGSWDSQAEFCRSAYRGGSDPREGSSIHGFRLVRQI